MDKAIRLYNGDLWLTSLGQVYVEASILARKEIIAGQVLRLPLIAWIYETLRRDTDRRIAWDHFFDNLQDDFGDLTEEQLKVVIGWGRHAELFAYDDDVDELYLEE